MAPSREPAEYATSGGEVSGEYDCAVRAVGARNRNNKIDVADRFPAHGNTVIIDRGRVGIYGAPESLQPTLSGDVDECQQR
jgi:hypothetical protein